MRFLRTLRQKLPSLRSLRIRLPFRLPPAVRRHPYIALFFTVAVLAISYRPIRAHLRSLKRRVAARKSQGQLRWVPVQLVAAGPGEAVGVVEIVKSPGAGKKTDNWAKAREAKAEKKRLREAGLEVELGGTQKVVVMQVEQK